MISDSTLKAIDKAKEALSEIPGGVETAMMRAFNRALQQGRTAATRAVTRSYTVKAKEVRPTFKMYKANRRDLNAELLSRGRNLPLSAYAHKPRKDTTGNARKQVRVSIKKDGGFKPLGQAFVHQGRIFKRLGASRLPIEQQFGPSVPGALGNEKVIGIVSETMGASVEKRLEHETQRLLDKHKTKG